MTGHEFYLDTINKTIDIDSAYGGQCWDLFAYYCQKMGTKIINCTKSGYVKDLWLERNTNGILNDYDIVDVSNLQDGDWVIFRETKQTPFSHVAMFRKYNENGTITVLGQNQGSNVVNQIELYYKSHMTYGAFRHKKLNQKTNDIKNYGTVRVIVDVLNVRNRPSTNATVEARYTRGMELAYDSIVSRETYYWAHYVSYNGDDRYIALGEVNGDMYVEYI